MSTWNHRVIQFPEPDAHFAIHEVYYDDDGKPSMYTVNAPGIIWDVEQGPLGALQTLEWMRAALSKPVLTPADFTGNPDDV